MSILVEKIDGLSISRPLSAEEKLESPGPYAALIRDALDSAVNSGASDVHFEPNNEGIQIRIRSAGILETFYRSSTNDIQKISNATLRKSFFLELKRIAHLSLGKFGVAQDSRISFPSRRIEVRVNLIPTIYGDKVVFRLFFKDRSFALSESGLNQDALSDIRSVITKASGLIILSGETGSGKTTTLYSFLNELDRTTLNVSSLEDPVEHIFPGVNHTQVNERLTFGEGLRALLRQDPDVILVGEIRDTETAKLANRAAQTGHLVLSTVHTNRALSIPSVFEYYGVPAAEVVPNILFGANQRLVPCLCSKCSVPVAGTKNRRANVEGCENCRKGFERRRQLLFEYFVNRGEEVLPCLKRSMQEEVEHYAKKGVLNHDEIEDYCNLRSSGPDVESMGG